MDIAKKYTVYFEGTALMKDIPEGTQIRGAFGETMLNLDLPAKTQFENNTPTTFYFHDAFPVHTDGGIGYPLYGKDKMVHYFCSKCTQLVNYNYGQITLSRLDRDTKKVSIFPADSVTGRFVFDIVANLRFAEQVQDLEDVLGFIKDYGLRIGKRHNKGNKLTVTKVESNTVNETDIEKRADHIQASEHFNIHFLSNAIIKTEPKQSMITALHFFMPNAGMIEGNLIINVPASVNIFMLHYKQTDKRLYKTEERGAPKGYTTPAVVQTPNKTFYIALALAEQLYGIGDWVPFGKGNFKIEVG